MNKQSQLSNRISNLSNRIIPVGIFLGLTAFAGAMWIFIMSNMLYTRW